MNRQPGFEKLYAKMHDIAPEDLVQYRFGSKDGYRLPQMASHYRLYCETLDSIVVELPEGSGISVYNYGEEFENGSDRMREECVEAIKAAGLKVTP